MVCLLPEHEVSKDYGEMIQKQYSGSHYHFVGLLHIFPHLVSFLYQPKVFTHILKRV